MLPGSQIPVFEFKSVTVPRISGKLHKLGRRIAESHRRRSQESFQFLTAADFQHAFPYPDFSECTCIHFFFFDLPLPGNPAMRIPGSISRPFHELSCKITILQKIFPHAVGMNMILADLFHCKGNTAFVKIGSISAEEQWNAKNAQD